MIQVKRCINIPKVEAPVKENKKVRVSDQIKNYLENLNKTK
jgi:hypothetical protein